MEFLRYERKKMTAEPFRDNLEKNYYVLTEAILPHWERETEHLCNNEPCDFIQAWEVDFVRELITRIPMKELRLALNSLEADLPE